jgi:CheY-like chemotaxis protein
VAQRQPISLGVFLKEAVKLLGRILPETIQIISEVSGEECFVDANPTQLQQVFMNLVVNARDAMPEGGTLRVELSRVHLEQAEPELGLAPGGWGVWMIADTGTGMTLEVQKHIFEPFFSTKRPDRGTGLGLAQVYGIVKQYGGEIHMLSEVGKGTTFWIYLPLLVQEEESEAPRGDQIQKGRGETILVVEDEGAVLAATTAMLESLNYRVLTAVNGQQALEVYEHHRAAISLVLTDLVLPEMDGKRLLAALKARDPEVRVVIMTGYPLGGPDELQELQGIAGFMEKPMVLGKLALTLHQILKGA